MSATSLEVDSAVSTKAGLRPISWPICVATFFLGNVLLWANRTNFSVAATAWARDFHWTPSTIGAMLSAFSFGYLVMQPFGGWLADRIGPRKTFVGTMIAWSTWVLLTPIAPGVLWLTGMWRVLLGISEAPYIPSIAVAVAKAVPSDARRGRFSSFMESGAQVGPAAGVLFAGLILKATGAPSMIFIVFGAFGIVLAIAWWLYAMRRADPAPAGNAALTDEAQARALQARVPYAKLITSRALWPFYIGWFALPYCQYIFLTWLPQYLTHYRHFSLAAASALTALPFLAAWFSVNFGGWTMDFFASRGWKWGHFHRKSLMATGAILYAVCTWSAAMTASNALAVDLIIVANCGLSFYVCAFLTTVTDIAPNQAGTLTGILFFFGTLGGTLSPYVSGVIAEATGAFVAPLQVAVAIMLVGAAVVVGFFRVRPIDELTGMTGGAA